MSRRLRPLLVLAALAVCPPAHADASEAPRATEAARAKPRKARKDREKAGKDREKAGKDREKAGRGGGLPSLEAHLGRRLDDKYHAAKPANAQVTWPGVGPVTWGVDAAVSATACARCTGHGVQVEVGGGLEYHRDTAPATAKNLVAAGLTAELLTAADYPQLEHDLKLTAEYHRDFRKRTGSAVAYLDYVPGGLLAMGHVRPPLVTDPHSCLGFEWHPTLSVEYGGTFFGAAADRGSRLRLRARAEVTLYPAQALARQRLYLSVSAELRDTVVSTVATEPAGHLSHLFVAGLGWKLDDAGHAAVVLQYLDGANPREGQDPERSLRLTMSVKL